MKDKPGDRLTMEETALKLKDKKGKKGKIFLPNQEIYTGQPTPGFSDAEEKAREDYNKNILNISPEYAEFTPTRKVIVRCYVMEAYTSEAGIFTMPDLEVAEMTANGMSVRRMVPSPWPYSRRAVVVSVPKNFQLYQASDEVLIERHTILAKKANENAPFHLPKGFTVDSWHDLEPPHQMDSEHYGYLILEPQTEILGELKKKDNESSK